MSNNMYYLDNGVWRELEQVTSNESYFYIDGKPLQDYGIDVELTSQEPISPPLTNDVLFVPGKSGAYDLGARLEPRVITLDCLFPRQTYSDLKRQIREFNKLLFDDFGEPKEFKLISGDEPDVYYNVRLSSGINIDRTSSRGRALIELTAYDPYAYSNYLSEEITWGSEVITFEFNYLLGHEGLGGEVKVTSPQTVNVTVEGLAINPVFEIIGTANDLTISAIGYEFTIPDFVNTEWSIDFQKYVVYKNGQETMIEIRDFALMPGNNEIKITGTNINVDMRIKYRDKFN